MNLSVGYNHPTEWKVWGQISRRSSWNLWLPSNHTWRLHKAFAPLDTVRPHPSAESPG